MDAASERLFWALGAQKNLTAYGADCSNVFAEAPPPVHPLYMKIDEAYRDWWENHRKKPPIPSQYTVVRVQNAIQGHPESPRLWEKLIDSILRNVGFHPTTHEPCLYRGIIQGQYTLFLWHVHDFAIATSDEATANHTIQTINSYLRLPIHNMGIINHFNGINIKQTLLYVKIHCSKYITKMTSTYTWIEGHKRAHLPLPFPSDKQAIAKLIQYPVPQTDTEKKALEQHMGIKYRHVMGEVLYPMAKCRLDVSVHAILLSQYMNNPGEEHYQALKSLVCYLASTSSEGIYYWRQKQNNTLPYKDPPTTHDDNYELIEKRGTNSPHLITFVDSDWATHTAKRTYLTGMILMFAGGAVGYKTK